MNNKSLYYVRMESLWYLHHLSCLLVQFPLLNVRLKSLRNMHHLLYLMIMLLLLVMLLQHLKMMLLLLLMLHLLRRHLLMGTMALIATKSVTSIETESNLGQPQCLFGRHLALFAGLKLLVVHTLGVYPSSQLSRVLGNNSVSEFSLVLSGG